MRLDDFIETNINKKKSSKGENSIIEKKKMIYF